jgi:glycerophosphoryl diester phosphodiesterase
MQIMKPKEIYTKLFYVLLLSLLFISACSTTPIGSQEPIMDERPGNLNESRVWIIAHRGARSLAPENTLLAASKALEHQADGWELDVAMSLDGELVVLHDDTLERTSDAIDVFPDRKPWSVYDFSFEDLRTLDFGSWFVGSDPFEQGIQGNITSDEMEAYRGVRIPTLREALEFTKANDWWVNIEIKDAGGTHADGVIVAETLALVDELEMEEQVLISSFNFEYLQQVRALNPSIQIGLLVNQIVMDPVKVMREMDAQAYHPSMKYTYAKQVQELREAGYAVNVWTVNEESDMQELIEMGVTGIITDFPQILKAKMNP